MNTTARRVMIIAHATRRAAAARWNCRLGEIAWSECLRMAWADVKAESRPQIKVNDKGFVVFASRNWARRGDRGTWARVEENGTITVQLASNGIISSAFIEEMEAFCAAYGQDFSAMGRGERINFVA